MAVLVVDIVGALKSGDASFKTLSGLEFEYDSMGVPLFSLGASAVVFRVKKCGRYYALRCYIRSKLYLKEIYGERYFPEELQVGQKYIDVVLCDWVDGESLRKVVNRALESGDRVLMGDLAESFEQLAGDMLSRKDWAHGDLSTSNIIVGEDLNMSLIDNDSNYIEALKGRKSSELGTPAFQSPLRKDRDFNPDIDDFSIALISVALRALSVDMRLVDRYPFKDGLLLDGTNIFNRGNEVLRESTELLARFGIFHSYRIAKMLPMVCFGLDLLPSLVTFPRNRYSGKACDLEIFSVWGSCGYRIVSSGEVVIPPLFDEAFDFVEDEALVRADRWWFYIDRAGCVVKSCGEWLKGKPPVSRFGVKKLK